MKRKLKNLKPRVFFDASVILAGLKSPRGGSGKLLSWVKDEKIAGIISEVVLDEVLRHLDKLRLTKKSLVKLLPYFILLPAPKQLNNYYYRICKDIGDVHLFTSAKTSGCNYLVSLDKKHVLILNTQAKGFKIVSPKELIEKLIKP